MVIRIPKKFVLVVALGVAAIAVGVAIAAWSTSGTGTGYAKAGTASALTLSDATSATTAGLYPGATAPAFVKVTNPNSFPVTVTQVAQVSDSTITSDGGAACNASTGVTFSTRTGLSLPIAAGATETFSLAGAVSMSNASDNSCQGATFSIPVQVLGVSAG